MVGVPGKYKGCETCRLRRVKCDNQRPFCRKCIDGGRECAGYERETVFIIGTIEDQGRCSSHPPRVVKPRRGGKAASSSPKAAAGSSSSSSSEDEKFELKPREPLRPAWDDLIPVVSSRGKSYRLQIAALHTNNLQAVMRAGADDEAGGGGGGKPVFVSLPPYEPQNVQPGLGQGEGEFRLSSQCLVHLATPDEEQGVGTGSATESICLFLYETNNSSYFSNQPHWKDPSGHTDTVRRMGPENFRSFPNHHIFVRVYRPSAIFAALLHRTPTFLAEPQWLTTPFEFHGKSALDRLLDTLALLPSLLARADRILAHEPGALLARRLMAQDLLLNCLDVEAELGRWWGGVQGQGRGASSSSSLLSAAAAPSPSSITTTTSSTTATTTTIFPFPENNNNTRLITLALTYYYASLVLLHPTIWRLYFAAVLDPLQEDPHHHHHHSSPLPIPPRLQTLDPMRYSPHRTRECAAHVCRGLAHLLLLLDEPDDGGNDFNGGGGGAGDGSGAVVQPDLLWHPLFVVRRFYEEEEMAVAGYGSGGAGGNTGIVMQMGTTSMGSMHMGVDVDMSVVGMDMDMGMSAHGRGGAPMVAGDGRLELMWCDGFRERLLARAGEIREVVQARTWVELACFLKKNSQDM
ncbi:uncharacterized protein B0T15DRAFT_421602 [Chaetomium strumarium]|uniref:Zn(2)-C6 fungal-type domain-containing protein n=1 Tax=Chaetomium strumarium TaxID=1170767 RepID=A0AAJ0LY76_9PEZI|nr:hypothetical protein B0T15DRAFT_421602 [Chaetomium strumarium]